MEMWDLVSVTAFIRARKYLRFLSVSCFTHSGPWTPPGSKVIMCGDIIIPVDDSGTLMIKWIAVGVRLSHAAFPRRLRENTRPYAQYNEDGGITSES
jgi:hypothetical protein